MLMLIPLLVATAPQAFVDAVDHRIAGTKMHVADWWADDLDGDKVPESIAKICDDDSGFFLVMHGTELMEAPLVIDGRNDCDAASRPAWTTRQTGEIGQSIAVHHGSLTNAYAIRDKQLVMIREQSHGFDVNRDGSHDVQDDITDYDKMTWLHDETPGTKHHGPLVIATPNAQHATTIVGKTTISATWTGDSVTLHVHADRTVTVRNCNSVPCTTNTKLGKGDADIPSADEQLEVFVGGTLYLVHVEHIDVDQRFPPPRAW